MHQFTIEPMFGTGHWEIAGYQHRIHQFRAVDGNLHRGLLWCSCGRHEA